MLLLAAARADDSRKGEDWRWYIPHGDTLAIKGASNCREGRIVIRVYAKEGDELRFVGVADTYVEGYAFEAFSDQVVKPEDIAIRYSIDPKSDISDGLRGDDERTTGWHV